MRKAPMATLDNTIIGFFTAHPELLLGIIFLFSFFLFFFFFGKKGKSLVSWPVLGSVPSSILAFDRVHGVITRLHKKRGMSYVLKGPWFTSMELVITCDPATVKYTTATNFNNYPKGDGFSEIFEIYGENGIFIVDGDAWTFQKKMVHALMSHRRFQKFTATVGRKKLEDGFLPLLQHIARRDDGVDLQDVLQRYTLDIMCLLLYGIDLASLSIDLPMIPFAKALDDASDAVFFRHILPSRWWKLMRRFKVGKEKKLAEAWKIFDDFTGQLITSRREKLNNMTKNTGDLNHEEEENPTDLLTSFINYQSNEETEQFKSDKFLRDTTLNLLLAGNTTSAALSWFFWEISRNPAMETRILEEIHEVLSNEEVIRSRMKNMNKPVVFDSKDLEGCVYLQAAMNETLRLYPPIPLNHKSPQQPDVLPTGHKVYPSTKIILSFYSMGRMEEIWGKDCLEFKPERWITEQGTLKNENPFKFPAFNAGPRTCLGKSLALSLMKAVAATILFNFSLRVVEGHLVYPMAAVILLMKNGLRVRVDERRQ